MQPILPQDFRPISLCNVIYKIIAKSLADRLKPHLPTSIDQSQATFIKNRHISSNIVITKEINCPLFLPQKLEPASFPSQAWPGQSLWSPELGLHYLCSQPPRSALQFHSPHSFLHLHYNFLHPCQWWAFGFFQSPAWYSSRLPPFALPFCGGDQWALHSPWERAY